LGDILRYSSSEIPRSHVVKKLPYRSRQAGESLHGCA
jgi:hypothetical protein